jgi:hypothetical protein
MADQNPPRFRVTCRHCRCPVLDVYRIGDTELDALRDHARRCFPDDAPVADADAGAVLRDFNVTA